jgi:hypothetical protein
VIAVYDIQHAAPDTADESTERPVMPPIGCFVWSGCHDQAVAAGSPANSRRIMLPADVAVRLQPGRPEESAAGGLQAHSGHDAGAYW